jgi:two-component system sensor histidine kinase/response regulator
MGQGDGRRIAGRNRGFEALDKVFINRYDLVITDLQLPDIDGMEVTRRMRLWEKGRRIAADVHPRRERKLIRG